MCSDVCVCVCDERERERERGGLFCGGERAFLFQWRLTRLLLRWIVLVFFSPALSLFHSARRALIESGVGFFFFASDYLSSQNEHTHTSTIDNNNNNKRHIVAEMIEQSAPVKSSKHSQIPELKSHLPLPEHTLPLSPPFHPNGSSPLGHSISVHPMPRFPISHFIPNIRPLSQLP